MKPVLSYLLIASTSLAVAACGGGSGSGSSNGNSAKPGTTLTNPPTAAKGTLSELTNVLGKSDDGEVANSIQNLVNEFKMPSLDDVTGLSTPTCGSIVSGSWDDEDGDSFVDRVHFRGNNCEMGSQDGLSLYLSKEVKSSDSDKTKFWANAEASTKTQIFYKKTGTNTTQASEYSSAKVVLNVNKGISLSFKAGAFSNLDNVVPPTYRAYWLDITKEDNGDASVSGYIQYYKEGKGLVTLTVTSANYEFNDSTNCFSGQITVKYADGSDAAGAQTKNICFSSGL